MKKILFLFLSLFLIGGLNANAKKYYADLSTANAVGNATWTAGTNTFAWTAGSYAYMVVPGGSFSGDLSEYTTIGLTVSDLENEFRVDILANGKTFTGKSITANGNIVLDIFNDFNLQWNPDKITVEDLKSVTAVRLNTNSASGSAVVTKFYIAKPASLTFNDSGVAEVDFTDLVATGGLSFNEETGELTNDGTGGTFYINMPTDGIDFTNMTAMTVNKSGDDVIDHLNITDTKNSISNGFWGSKYGVNFTVGDATKFNNATNVNSVVWTGNSVVGTLKISSIVFNASVITCALPGEPEVLNTLQYHNFPSGSDATATWNLNTATDTYYGSGSSSASNYVDLTGYEELRIHRANKTGFRAFFINAAGDGTNNINNNTSGTVSWNETEKYWIIDLSKVEKYNGKTYLNTIKSEAWGVSNVVTNITVYKTPEGAANYRLSGKGSFTPATIAALADANATYIDATGITAATLLTSANPNCMFTANDGMLTNASNVIVGSTCANFALTDGATPFAAPVDFTATNVSYNRSFKAGQPSTVCLPYALTEEEVAAAGEFYELTDVEGTEFVFTKVASTTAYKPYLFKAKTDGAMVNLSGKAIPASATAELSYEVDGYTFKGVLSHSSDVAGDNAGKTVYGWNSESGAFVKVGEGVSINAFRAYVTVNNGSSARLATRFVGGSITGINELNASEAQKIDGKFFKNGKLVILKNGVKYNAAGAQIK